MLRTKLARLLTHWAVLLDRRVRIYDPGYEDIGKQRIEDGVTYTLAKVPMAAWVPTDDVREAVGVLGAQLEQTFGSIDWDTVDMGDMAREQRETVKEALVK